MRATVTVKQLDGPVVPQAACSAAPGGCSGDVERPEHLFLAMLDAFRHSGGLARGQEIVDAVRSRNGPDVALLARWIVERKLISFEWQADMWLPWFQFNRADMTPRPDVGRVYAELTDTLSSWELASWFARGHSLLDGRAPVDMVESDLAAVVQAARLDRFIARG